MSASGKSETVMAGAPRRSETKPGQRTAEIDVLARTWRFFTSVRLALVLILLLTLAVLAGTLLMQTPDWTTAGSTQDGFFPRAFSYLGLVHTFNDSTAYDEWFEGARDRYGIWANVFAHLGLLNVFEVFWFRLLIGLLTANIIVCTANRWKGIWNTAFHTRVRMGDAFFEHARFNASVEAAMPPAVAAERVERAFSRSRYRVRTETGDDSIAVFADRNRWSRFGTFPSHLSLVLILVGALMGSWWGVRDAQFIVAEGSTRELGLGTEISVELVRFADEYNLDGSPKDFYSDVVIYDKGEQVKSGTIRVNTPLGYEGFKFHQSSFGQAAAMQVRDEDGTVLFDEGVPFVLSLDENHPAGEIELPPEVGLEAYVVTARSGLDDPNIPAGELMLQIVDPATGQVIESQNLTQETPTEVAGLEFTFERELRYTLLSVTKDPGVKIIWIASTLMIVGLLMIFYFPHRRIWALLKPGPDGTTEVRIATTAQRDLSLAQEFSKLRQRVKLALGIADDDKDSSEKGEV